MLAPLTKITKDATYADYLTWGDGTKYELIDGMIYNMSPAPSPRHQLITGELYRQISTYLRGKTCKAFIAPFDVRFPLKSERDEDITTVVQPDISVACDRAKIDTRGCHGAPDWIIEVLSPDSLKKDMKEKLALYERGAVKEYWIVHPIDATVWVFCLDQAGQYGKPAIYTREDRILVGLFPDLTIILAEVFEEY